MKLLEFEKLKEKKVLNSKRIAIVLLIGIVLFFVLITMILYSCSENVRNLMDKYVLMKNIQEDNTVNINIDESKVNNVFAYDKYIVILNNNVLTNYNSEGKEEGSIPIEISNPIINTNGKYLLIAEKNSNKIYLVSGNEIVWKKELEGSIDKVTVNKNGYTSIILSGTTYKSVIQTFDNKGNEIFKTYLSSTIAIDSDISFDNQYLAFAEINPSGINANSTVKIISIQKAKTSPTESIVNTFVDDEGKILINLKYQDGNKLVCMYDSTIKVIQNEKNEEVLQLNEEKAKVSFAGIELINKVYKITEKANLLKNEITLDIYNVASGKINQYNIEGVTKEIYAYGDNVAINLGSEVHFINSSGWLIKKYISSQEIKRIVMTNNYAGIIYRNKIEIVQF